MARTACGGESMISALFFVAAPGKIRRQADIKLNNRHI
jgi:hypothetical protein